METLEIICPACNKTLKMQARHAGKTGRCPNCNTRMQVPVHVEPEQPPWQGENTAPEQPKPAGQPKSATADKQAYGQTSPSRIPLIIGITAVIAVILGTLIILPGKPSSTTPAVVQQPAVDADIDTDDAVAEVLDEIFGADTEEESTAAFAEPKPAVLAAALFKQASPAVVRVQVRNRNFELVGQGSGFFVSQDGLLVTNYHVIQGAYHATIRTQDETQYSVEGIAAIDEDADLALLKVKAVGLPFLNLHTDDFPNIGTKIYAIGNPLGQTNTLSEGIVSGHRPESRTLTMLQITAPISPGSSGGPVLTQEGKVAGVTTAYLTHGQNLNFAVPARNVSALIASQGEVKVLASAGGKPISRSEARKVDQAWEAYRQDDYAKALQLLTEVRQTQGESEWYWVVLGFTHWGLDNTDMAIAAFRQAAKINPSATRYRVNIGILYSSRGSHNEALTEFRAAINLEPDYAHAYYCLGETYRALARHDEARAAYRTAASLNPDDADAWFYLATLSSGQVAVNSYGKAIEILKRDKSPSFNLAYSYSHVSKHYYSIGNRTLAERNYNSAVQAWTRLIAADPESARNYFNLGVTHETAGRYSDAIGAFERVIQLSPDSLQALSASVKIDWIRRNMQRRR